MKNIKFSRPVAYALVAGFLDIAGILGVFYLLSLIGFKAPTSRMTEVLNVLFVVFYFPAMIFNPFLWAVFGFVLGKAVDNIRRE